MHWDIQNKVTSSSQTWMSQCAACSPACSILYHETASCQVEPVLSGHLSKSRKLRPLISVILTTFKRSPLLNGRRHPLLSLNELL